jgi:murein DD-endopeptidase MepM/ murein hydrolase activator NlpD
MATLATSTTPATAVPCVPLPGKPCSPAPGPSASPSASAHPSASPSAKPGSPAPAAKPSDKPGPGTQPSPSAAAQAGQIAARFQNAAFLDDLLAVLNHPTADQKPDLKHFRIASGKTSEDPLAAAGADRATPAAEIAVFAVLWTIALGVALGLSLRRRIRFGRIRAGAILALIPVVAVTAAGLRAASPPAPATPTAAVSIRAFGPGLKTITTVDDLDHLHRFLQPDAPTWNRLISIESQVALHQDQLQDQEARIKALATAAISTDSPQASAATSEPGTAPNVETSLGATEVDGTLGRLLAQHDVTSQAYKQALQQEYELYREAAQQAPLRDQLLNSVATLPEADARDAVSYDLDVLQTQLTQESAINAAETKLSAIGSLTSTQLAAMRRHQPFIIPIEAPETQGFGPTDFSLEPPITFNGVFYPHFHTGLDLAGPVDSPIHAAADGVVALATATQDGQGHLTGYGNYVVIAHPDGFFTLYGHLNTVAVKEGQVVHQGEIIGQEGSTGASTGPHVHFEIRHNGSFLDPLPYLQGQAPG